MLKFNPKNVDALTYGGYTYMSLNNPAKALQYLNKAYKITGDDSLKSQIDNIKATSGAQAENPAGPAQAETLAIPAPGTTVAPIPEIAPVAAQKDSFYKWFLIGADAFFIGASLITYIDFNNTANNYNNTYSQIDNTTADNYSKLLSMRNSAMSKQATFQIFTALACASAADTIIDMLFIHAAFPVTAEYIPEKKEVELSFKDEF